MCRLGEAGYRCHGVPPPPPQAPAGTDTAPPLILDTDLSIDVDDVGTVCLAHALADRCEVRILAMVHNTGLPNGTAGLSVINEFYGRGDVPVGAYRGPVGDPAVTSRPGWTNRGRGVYVDDMVASWPQGVQTGGAATAPDALTVLRASLAGAADHSVVYVSVGHLTNLRTLVESEANAGGDELPSGTELVRHKVKRLLVMGGRTFSTSAVEWNFGGCGSGCGPYDALGGITRAALDRWPASVPISFLGFEAGVSVGTGGFFIRDPPPFDSPCRQAYRLFCSRMGGWCSGSGRASWDPMTLLYAVRGNTDKRYRPEVGTMLVNPSTGANDWIPSVNQSQPHGSSAPQENLILDVQKWRGAIAAEIDERLRQPPARETCSGGGSQNILSS